MKLVMLARMAVVRGRKSWLRLLATPILLVLAARLLRTQSRDPGDFAPSHRPPAAKSGPPILGIVLLVVAGFLVWSAWLLRPDDPTPLDMPADIAQSSIALTLDRPDVGAFAVLELQPRDERRARLYVAIDRSDFDTKVVVRVDRPLGIQAFTYPDSPAWSTELTVRFPGGRSTYSALLVSWKVDAL